MNATTACRIEPVVDGAGVGDSLAELHGVCFESSLQTPWSAAAIATLLATPGTHGAAALTPSGDLAGFVIGRAVGEEVEVLTLCVAPHMRRHGVATALLEFLWHEVWPGRRFVLEVAETNRAAHTLYAGLGFQQVGRRPNYYRRDGRAADALVLARHYG